MATEEGDEVKEMEFDRDDVDALKKRLRENKLFDLTPSEERRLAAEEKARKEAEERARRAAKAKARLEAEEEARKNAPRGSFSFRPEALTLQLKEGQAAPAQVAVAFDLKTSGGADPPAWWRADQYAPQAVKPKDADPENGNSVTFDLEGVGGLFPTDRFLLSEKSLKGLLAMSVEVTVHAVAGEAFVDGATDPAMAAMSVPLSDLLVDQLPELKAELPLGAYEEPPAPEVPVSRVHKSGRQAGRQVEKVTLKVWCGRSDHMRRRHLSF